jgi:PHP domain
MKKNGAILFFLMIISLLPACFASSAQSPSPTVTSYQILKVNLHAHTNYSDGTYSPSELVDIYKDAGYDVLGITDHNTVAGYEEALSEGKKVGLIVVCGEEVTCSWSDGSWKHVLALFTNKSIGVAEGSDVEVEAIFDAIHTQNGIGIVAHPWFSWDNWQKYTNETCIDGWEVDYSMTWILQSDYIYMLGHDFHNATFLELLPNYYTYVLAQNRTEAGVKEALMQKRIVVNGDGNLYGSAYALGLYFQSVATPSPTNTPLTPTATPSPTRVPSLTPTSSTFLSPSPSNQQTFSPEPTRESRFVIPIGAFIIGCISVIAIMIMLFLKRSLKSGLRNRKL